MALARGYAKEEPEERDAEAHELPRRLARGHLDHRQGVVLAPELAVAQGQLLPPEAIPEGLLEEPHEGVPGPVVDDRALPVDEPVARVDGPEVEIDLLGLLEPRVEAFDCVENIPLVSEVHAGVGDVRALVYHPHAPQRREARVAQAHLAPGHDVRARRLEGPEHLGHPHGVAYGVGVDERDYLAGRLGDAVVARDAPRPALDAEPDERVLLLVALDDLLRAVCAVIVDNDYLVRPDGLPDEAVERVGDEALGIAGDDDHGDAHGAVDYISGYKSCDGKLIIENENSSPLHPIAPSSGRGHLTAG